MELVVRTSDLAGFKGEYAVRSFCEGNALPARGSAPRLLAPQLIDRGIKIGAGDMRTDLVENGKFAFERGNDGRHAGIARRGR